MGRQFGNWGSSQEDGYWRKGPWTAQEDKLLIEHVNLHGEGRWNSVSKLTGLKRSGKSCRLRWVNYLRPDLKRGKITPEEENLILELHALWGNRWSTIARSLPGRTDNEIKNYWRTHFKKNKPSKNVERARARFLMQQQEQKKKKQKEIEDEEQEKKQQAMAMMSYQAEEEATLQPQDIQDMAYLYPLTYLLQGGSGATDIAGDVSAEDSGSWGSLWNLDDVPDDGDGAHRGRISMQDQELAFY